MRILLIHNSYRQSGGEDVVARAEAALLRTHGHAVDEYWRSNTELPSGLKAASIPFRAVWSREAIRDIQARIDQFRPDVVHVHNTWLMISPAVYQAARRGGAVVVQTLHNYRLLCPKATMLRNGRPANCAWASGFPPPASDTRATEIHACKRPSWERLSVSIVGSAPGGGT